MKKYVLFGVLLLSLVLLSSCTITGKAVDSSDPCFGLKSSARDNCYFEQHRCSLVKNEAFRDSCVAELARAKGDPAVCNLIKSDRTQGYCLELLAEQANDYDRCRTISDDYWKDNCNYHFATIENKAEYCGLISNLDQQQDCYHKIALATNDAALCEKLGRVERKACLVSIAVARRDIALCQKVGESLENDACRYKVAKKSGNKLFCEDITIHSVKRECNDIFTENK